MSKRWKIFAVLALMYILAYFFRISMAVVARDLAADLALTAAQLGTLSGVFFYIYGVVQIPLGPLLDRFGGRKVISVFGLFSAAGGFLFALAPNYGVALAARLLIGAGTACVLMGALKIFTAWFSRQEFAAVSGFMVAVGNLGNLAATAPLAFAVSLFGWRASFLAVGAVQLAVALLVFLMVRDHPPAADQSHREDAAPDQAGGIFAAWRVIFADRSFWLLAFLSFCWYGNYMVLQGLWGGPYLMEAAGLDRAGAGRVLLCTSLGFIIGSALQGRITNRLFGSHKRTLLFGQTLLLILMTIMLGPAERFPRILLDGAFFLIGIAVSSGVTIYPMVREMFPVRIVATALTSLNFFVLMGAAMVQQGMGIYIERFPRGPAGYPPQAYHGAFLIPICCLALAVVLFLFVKDTKPTHS
jgi:sugar phosphate permease